MEIKNAEFVIFDVETTGLSALNGDRIVEIAAIKIKNFEKIGQMDSLINPERDIPFQAQAIHGISNEMVSSAPTRDEVLPKIIDFIGGACLVGHNISFDLKFLCYELSCVGRKLHQATPSLDTLKMARGLIPYLNNYRLGHLANALGVKVGTTHRALADVELTSSIFSHLIRKAYSQHFVSFPELYKKFGVDKPQFAIQQLHQETLF
jgi:DNA polymerase III epsilon subunit